MHAVDFDEANLSSRLRGSRPPTNWEDALATTRSAFFATVSEMQASSIPFPYLYSAWFRDLTAPDDAPDLEWPACFIITGPTAADALAWGDILAHDFARRRGTERYLSSTVEPATEPSDLLRIAFGHHPTDAELGRQHPPQFPFNRAYVSPYLARRSRNCGTRFRTCSIGM